MNNTYFPNQDISVSVTYKTDNNLNGLDLASTDYNNYDYSTKFYSVETLKEGQEVDYSTIKSELKFSPKTITTKKIGDINALEIVCDLRLLKNSPQGYLILEVRDPTDHIMKYITLGKFIRQIIPR